PIIHLVDTEINDMVDRLKRYTDARAQDLAKEGLPKFRTTLRKGLTRFYKSYFARKGYKEGRMGFLLALMAMLFVVLSHIKAEVEIQKSGR
ncbi:MAG: glycosyltransferase family 2 protein, partial [Pseudomonadota bacterium]|nr:glycosyltransferase family 2 protein [Pseudomonadota bacterium]